MSDYPFRTLVFQEDIRRESKETLSTIRELDSASESLGVILDKEISNILRSDRSRDPMSLTQGQLESATNLKLALEAIAAKKLDLAVRLYDFLDLNIKLLDNEMIALEQAILNSGGKIRYSATESSEIAGSVPQKRKRGRPRLNPPPEEVEVKEVESSTHNNVPTNEPLYCICNSIAFGEMIACDNEDCPIEWFHYPCVNLTKKPKNSWVCSLCSNKRKK